MTINTKYLHSEITNTVLKAFYTVLNELPFGLEPDIYKNALKLECEHLGQSVEMDKEMKISYREKIIGSFRVDLMIENQVIVLVSTDEDLDNRHDKQAKNQLKLTDLEVALILNFGVEGDHRRVVLTNDLKRKN